MYCDGTSIAYIARKAKFNSDLDEQFKLALPKSVINCETVEAEKERQILSYICWLTVGHCGSRPSSACHLMRTAVVSMQGKEKHYE